MDNTEQLNQLRGFVQGVRQYYMQCGFARDGAFSIPHAMVAFALSGIDTAATRDLLESLFQKEQILSMNERKITFSQAFIDGRQ